MRQTRAAAPETIRHAADSPEQPTWPAWGAGAWLLLLVSGMLVGWRRVEAPYADGDVLWGARAGRDFLSTWHIPRTDPYSWTAHGRQWIPNGWGWNVVLGLADKLGGLTGIALLAIAASGVIALALGARARSIAASPVWTTMLFQITAGVFALFFYPRAQLADYAIMFVLPLLLARSIATGRRGFTQLLAVIVIVQIAWMNLHTAAVLGPVLIAASGLGLVVMHGDARRAVAQRVGIATIASLAACLATPYGIAPITHIAAVRRASKGLITEWQPVGFGSAEQLLGVAALAIGLGATWLAWRGRRFDAVAVIVVLGVATAFALRFAPLLALYSVPELAKGAASIRVRTFLLNRARALALAVLGVACLAGLGGFAHPGSQFWSPKLVAALPHGCRLLNDLDIGGAVILERRDVPVSIDGRNDLYGSRDEVESIKLLNDPTLGEKYIELHGITCVLAPSSAPLVAALRTDPGWRVAGHDSVRTLVLRTSGSGA